MQYDHMIEALTTNRSDDSLYLGSLPRRARCRHNFADAHISHLLSEVAAEDRIAVAQQVTGGLGKGKGLPQLLSGPLCGRVGGNVEVQNAAAVMGQNQENVKNLEADCGHREKINGDQLLRVILEESAPSLRGRCVSADHVFADAAFRDIEPSLSSSPWIRGAPQRGFSRHILRIRSRTSREMTGRPGRPRRTFQVQNRRNAARCHATTVSGLTMASAERQSRQRRERQIQNRRSPEVNFARFGADLCSTPIWWRRARFSSAPAARKRRIEGTPARNVLKRRSINDNYDRKDKPHPFRDFEIFGRHSFSTCHPGFVEANWLG
jgi:hypothetical protein